MKKVLILNGQYLPGYKGGGPIRSIQNLVENLQNEFEFYILTSDRDFKMNEPYENIEFNKWTQRDNYKVFYMIPDKQNLKGFKEIINSVDYDVMYLNGYFSPIYTIRPLILRKLGKLKKKPVILSARGDFSKGHLKLKRLKKSTYIFLSKIIGLYRGLYWHATSDGEVQDIKDVFKEAKILQAPNLSAKPNEQNGEELRKEKLDTKLVFLSRICEKKNLLYALEVLKNSHIEGNVLFDIYGPIEDYKYWERCEVLIKELPSNIEVNYKGEVLPVNINSTLAQYHAFLFPTYGENYGHAIVEAFCAGCVPIISDQTPWRDLEKQNVGYDIPLEDINKYIETLEHIHILNNKEYLEKRNNSINYYRNKIVNIDDVDKIKEILNNVI